MAEWISVNMHLHRIQQDLKKEKMDEALKNAGLNKTRPTSPNLEKEIVKNKQYIIDEYQLGSSRLKYLRKAIFFPNQENTLNYISHDYYQLYHLKNNENLRNDLVKDLKEYNDFIRNHEKMKRYLENVKKYDEINEKTSKESKFENTDQAKPGNLVTLYCPDRDKYYYFLIGSSGEASDLYLKFSKTNFPNIKVVRAKQLVEEFDIVGDFIFD